MEIRRDRVILSLDSVGSEDINVTGQKPPIIFLHGMTSAKETWKNVLKPIAVATGRKAYAFDARNHGDSGWSDESGYDVMVEDLLEVMDVLLIDRAILVGHSMGGKTAMFFAGKWPKRVEKLIVEDISPKHAPTHLREQAQKYLHLLEHAVEQIPTEMSDLEEAKNFVHDFLDQKINQDNRSSRQGVGDGSCLPLYKDKNGEFKWKTNLSVIEKFLSVPNTTNVSEIYSSPTLILYGTKSPYKVSADRDFIRKYFPSAQFRAIDGATHQIHLEYEDIFVKEVADFINES